MNSINVEAIKLNSLPVDEAEAIRQAEAEAEAFYATITEEETERARLSDTQAICRIMWHNRFNAAERVTEYLNTNNTSFTEVEKTTLLAVARKISPDNDNHREATKALEFLTTTAKLHRTMQSGHYFNNLPVTELFKRHEAK